MTEAQELQTKITGLELMVGVLQMEPGQMLGEEGFLVGIYGALELTILRVVVTFTHKVLFLVSITQHQALVTVG
jgi:hypothetical protein